MSFASITKCKTCQKFASHHNSRPLVAGTDGGTLLLWHSGSIRNVHLLFGRFSLMTCRTTSGGSQEKLCRPLSRPPKASVWGHVQDQPRSACLVRMIWVKDQHAQHWSWTLSHWKQGGGAPLPPFCLGSMTNACLLYTSPSPRD